MNRLRSFIILLSIGFLGPAALLEGQSVPSFGASGAKAGETEALPDDINALLRAIQPVWTSTISVSAGMGYKDNLLLSYANPERSPFARAGVETLLWHVPTGSIDYFGFVNAEQTQFLARNTTVHHESQAFTGVEWRYRHGDAFSLMVDAQGYFLDQVFDISDTDIRRVVAELKVRGLKLGPTAHWAIRPWLWAEASATGAREIFHDGLNNATITDPVAKLGWAPTKQFELSVSGELRRRRFDRRTGYSATGRPETWPLRVHERDVEGRVVISLDQAQRWKTTTRVGRLRYSDNGSGYLNYRRRYLVQELDWTSDPWTLHLEGEAGHREYDQQTVGIGLRPPAMVKDEYDAIVRVERQISKRWTLFGEYTWERCRSNDVLSSYRMNEGLLGARWSWEK